MIKKPNFLLSLTENGINVLGYKIDGGYLWIIKKEILYLHLLFY